MIERIEGMPAGVLGLKATGKITRDDYTGVLEPALNEGIATGELRLVFLLTEYEGIEAGAWAEDVKTGLKALVRDHSAWKRFAFVTDVDWVAKAFRMFTWLTPGEVELFEPGELERAKAWAAG